ncbi:right-handed parallel beta-helix repeat-containing protein [Telmatobacter bradus]|uniref:right-handed parallel beta-helix repeat-containing protein n=1 Tax=Telmatobacter bradus TaxID=474953 RepID=UPI003B4388F8
MHRVFFSAVGMIALMVQAIPVCAKKAETPSFTITVSPAGDDKNPGTAEKPFCTLTRAQAEVRKHNEAIDVKVELAPGVYRLQSPLIFAATDGGRNGHHVVWQAAAGTTMENAPVLSGAILVSDWKLLDQARNLYVAETPKGLDARELWVNDQLMQRGAREIPRADIDFKNEGIFFEDAKYDELKKLTNQNRIEVEATGFFTDRFSPVEQIEGRVLHMQQPAWKNNIWGYDTMETPYHPEFARLFLVNALEFVSKPGDWYIDPAAGKLYLIPPMGADVAKMDVELPHLSVLLAVGNNLDVPVQDLTFKGLRFSHTTWLGASASDGYASQQSGAYLKGLTAQYPADPLSSCHEGCPAFETRRNEWTQIPASVQVAAAERIRFEDDVFAHLGQYALGIGNDAAANLTGVGLGASDVTVTRSVFTDDAGGAIEAGGVSRDAHHPHEQRQTNRQIVISNNRIRSVSKEYRDHTAILSTYVLGAVILHNDISDVPYDAIDIGYGWGIQDPGGNPNYRSRMHGYDWKENLVYDTPTTHRDVVVASNRIHGAKQYFHDGGAIYNLSASPGTLITENYIFDNNKMIGLYLDEGSRSITLRRNVVEGAECEWLNVNTVHAMMPVRVSPDNTAISNWHDGTQIGGLWTNYQNNLILDDHLVKDGKWPDEARAVMKDAGIEANAGPVAYGDARPGAGDETK